MNEKPRDFLVTYDPEYLEEHTESSEFEESITSIVPKNSNQFIIGAIFKNVTKKQKDILNRKISNQIFRNNELKKCTYNNIHKSEDKNALEGNNQTIGNKDIEQFKASEKITFNKGIQSNYKQKKSLIRHKVIPCISNMFVQSIPKFASKENQLKNISRDNACQVRIENHERRRRRKGRRQKYTVQPVYKIQCITQPFSYDVTQNTTTLAQDQNKSLRRVSSNIICNVTLSEDESEDLAKLKRIKHKKQMQSLVREGNAIYEHLAKNQEQQFPSKEDLYRVLATNQRQHEKIPPSKKNINPLHYDSSGFWEYIVEKFNKKYKAKKSKPVKRKDFSVQCYPVSSDKFGPYGPPPQRKNASCPDDDCPCEELLGKYSRNVPNDFAHNYDSLHPPAAVKRKMTASKNVQCGCHPTKRSQTKTVKKPSPAQLPEEVCSCQRPHDQMAEHLTNKYSGEILCIHNPRCILINGCFDMTQPKEVTSVNAWPVVQSKKDSFFRSHKKGKNVKQKQDQFSQYHAQSVEIQQCQVPQHKSEKIVQSLCSHNPPCEVIRCCYKQGYDPKLQNSCIHVPMCERFPECVMQSIMENQAVGICDHNPKCTEVPMCTRKYVALTARDSVGTQVKPQTKMMCRHDPPCGLIPKCLGRSGHETYISYEAIPNCVHQPLCDLIPACCRKSTKGMVSASSQYPNGCRVV